MYKTDCKYAVSISAISLLKLQTGVDSVWNTLLNMLHQSLIIHCPMEKEQRYYFTQQIQNIK